MSSNNYNNDDNANGRWPFLKGVLENGSSRNCWQLFSRRYSSMTAQCQRTLFSHNSEQPLPNNNILIYILVKKKSVKSD